ncbi:MAG TPA: LysM peptidoglycan-binding domain-containing protein [Gemmatimonadales bacterium]|nr:LysM peptidoglycan-binding domain-containing protein [Gemmatimonadales bacterium]
MTRKLIGWSTLLALAGCAPAIPPAPVVPAVRSAPDSLPSVEVSSTGEASADSVVNELAEAEPASNDVPALDADEIRWDIDVRTFASHPRVQYYLDYFQGVSRAGMKVFLERGARYEPMIRRRFEAEGLPGDLGYLALIESGYSNDAVSRSHAVGMWQFMRGTGRGYGLRIDSWVDERRDPVKATDAAARHLYHLRDRFGSLYLTAAAYNAGAGKVSRSLGKLQWDESEDADSASDALDGADLAEPADDEEESDVETEPSLEELETLIQSTDPSSDAAFFRLAGTKLLTSETQNYVPKLIAAAVIAKQPERFGITPPVPAPFAYDSIVVSSTTGLDVIARLAEVSLAEIKDLNPQYLRLATPPRSESVIRVPPGTGEQVAERYAALPPSERVQFLSHVVRRGERLTRIAARYHLPVREIQEANPRIKPSRLRAGSRLVIPTVAVPSLLAMRATGKAVAHRDRPWVATHRVRSGETLIGIARRYRVTLRALRRVNDIPVEYTLKAGKRLRIPS